MPLSLPDINALNQADFTQLLGPLYEDSPWVAEEAWIQRPFSSAAHLIEAMNGVMRCASRLRQMELICAHPELAGRFRPLDQLTESSQEEQASAGLTALSSEQAARFSELNEAYKNRFHFPFIICAKLNKVDQILAAFVTRLANTEEEEFQTALGEIEKIARLRLEKILPPLGAGKLSTHALDIYMGNPAVGLKVALYRVGPEEQFCLIATTETNRDGRTDQPLLTTDTFLPGEYELRFSVGEYLAKRSLATFLTVVPIRFQLSESAGYHIPLLFSPWAYSTYRGS